MKHLDAFIDDTEDPDINFALARDYEQQGQTGAAVSFYLRTAERSRQPTQQYHALIRMALCFERQKLRDDTESVLLQKAIGLMPRRPEAYFLLARLYEWQKRWHESFFIASVGCNVADFDLEPLDTDGHYPGEYALWFQKAVAWWWTGNCDESRQLFFHLRNSYHMNDLFTRAVNNNIQNLGHAFVHTTYHHDSHDRLRVKFPGSDRIRRNHSQSFQDLFVLAATQGHRAGTWLEIGCAEPFYGNNTALLETEFGWRGISIDLDERKTRQFALERDCLVMCANALHLDFEQVLTTHDMPPVIDYLQVDCDPPQVSFEILQRLPWARRQFRVITFEHDHYHDARVRDASREFLEQQGYQLIVSDVAFDPWHSYEDWWVRPDLVDLVILEQLKDITPGAKPAVAYMLPD